MYLDACKKRVYILSHHVTKNVIMSNNGSDKPGQLCSLMKASTTHYEQRMCIKVIEDSTVL